MRKIVYFLFFAFLVQGCSKDGLKRLYPSDFIVLHLTSIETEKRHEERLWSQLLISYNKTLKVSTDAVRLGEIPSRAEFDSRIQSMKKSFYAELDEIAKLMSSGDRLYYYSQETVRGTEFGYLIERDGDVVFKSGSASIIWE